MSSKDRLELLKKLQRARTGKSVSELYDDDDTSDRDDQVYELVDEEEFQRRKRLELLQDNFVVDDDGLGYVDRGVDEWDSRNRDDADSSDDEGLRKGASRGKKRSWVQNANPATIKGMLTAHSKTLGAQPSKKLKKLDVDDFEDILDQFGADDKENYAVNHFNGNRSFKKEAPTESRGVSLFGSLNASADSKKPFSRLRRKDEEKRANNTERSPPVTVPSEKIDSTDSIAPIGNDLQNMINDVENSPTMVKKDSKLDLPTAEQSESESEEEEEEEVKATRRTVRTAAIRRAVNFNIGQDAQSSPFVTAPNTPIALAKPSASLKSRDQYPESVVVHPDFSRKVSPDEILDKPNGSFKFYWLDYTEVDNTLLLFGKIKTIAGKMISAMLQVSGICKELYFLPRENKKASDVHDEIIPLIMDKYGLESVRAKPEVRKYAFELAGIPAESEYLKVLLPYQTPKSRNVPIPAELEGDSFYHVFGGNANIFESFVLQRKIMGPCWLEIKNADFNALANASHCSMEIKVNSPQNVAPANVHEDAGLNCLSLSVQTVMNLRENKQEVVSITLSHYKNVAQNSPTPDSLSPDELVTLVRPPKGTAFPTGLPALAKKEIKGQLRLFNNEKALLSCFCAMMKASDADVLLGHRLENLSLDIIMHRLFELKIPTFSSLGRRGRKSWPDRFGRNNSNSTQFLNRDILSGRLLCDISNEMGQSLTPKCQNWELPEMYFVACQKDHKSLDINFQASQYQSDVNAFILALNENISNALISAEIAFRIQIISLTKQLTNLAGNAWSQTLAGSRAGRNEYILLHEFANNNYIVPDKETKSQRTQRQNQDIGGDVDEQQQTSSKKAQYQGGLVFEPEKGLHTDYILVMDFNSLYPSIIQEFNICFTTVKRDPNNIEELPNVPSTEEAQGVLPKLLANLVQRRREVKKIMSTETNLEKKTQCDIRQQALKLTANSMYGCLGYVNSRFYAKPLAMLVTNKGREILMNTRQLAESLALAVVYGDTDSVMLNSGCDEYAEAIKIGNNFKKLVNERYRLLEIDIDNVYKKLLLHAKKKYAALNVFLDKSGTEHTSLEVKGLDMKRREFCPLSKEVSTHVLNTILSDRDPESALQDVYAYMEETRSNVENNEIRLDKYKINTRLSKDPKAYPGGRNMPAVQVALRMREMGRVVKAGSVITFVITKQDDDSEDDEQLSVADRARALNEVMSKNNDLRPDPLYYLEKQIFAPVERLLERIESFDIVRLSESLGLDSRRYLNHISANGDLGGNRFDSLEPLESSISDSERFKNSAQLTLRCPNCKNEFLFGGIVASNHYTICYNGLKCRNCDHLYSPIQLSCQLERSIRAQISLYYAGWVQCDDSTCNNQTRSISVFGKRCLNEGCTGVMKYRYSDKQLYNQLLYFESLFDVSKNKSQQLKPLYSPDDSDKPTHKLPTSQVAALSEQNRELFEIMNSVVQKYLSDCGRRYVDMKSIFSFMGPP
ncbi:LAMI_0D00716g1_1 [Lachancea mirantina]|uniref:DNA polymerase n=1 Tax=Lachancea mirantina TaxID=1230905 RepID=A0A1G4J8L9_9SACH|nr:LAMI_0D00716g1_1 [Lachancea mirantina]